MAERAERNGKDPEGTRRLPTPGERLRQEREQKGLSVAEVARELHLDAWIVEAMERDDHEAFGAPVFAKGHLRKYAALVGIASEDIMIAYYQGQEAAEAPALVTDPVGVADEETGSGWKAGVALGALVVVLGGLWWLSQREAPPESQPVTTPQVQPPTISEPDRVAPLQAETAAPAPVEESLPEAAEPFPPAVAEPVAGRSAEDALAALREPSTAAAPATAAPDASASEPVPALEEPAAGLEQSPPPQTAAAAPSEPAIPEAVEVVLTFSQDSWVEIRASDGARLLFGMARAGDVEDAFGAPPIGVFLGNHGGVEIEVDGQPFDIPEDSKRGNTARFTIGPAVTGEP